MTPSFRLIVLLTMLCPMWSCKVHNDALRAEVLGAVLPDGSCAYTPSNPTYQEGYYDPAVDGGSGYTVTLNLRNNMQDPQTETVPSGPVSNIIRRGRDLQVTSVDACWYFADDADTFGKSGDGGEVIDCSTIPEQSARIQAFGHIDEGGSLGLMQATILTLPHLQALFGPTYEPSLIPVKGAFAYNDPSINPSVAGGNQQTPVRAAYSFAPEDPRDLRRSVYWGAKYPNSRSVSVVVQLQVNLQMQSGEEVKSNWFVLPISVCTGCMQDFCGPLVQKVCARGPCADGTECLSNGQCSDPKLTCSALTLYSGARPSFYANSTTAPCSPAQRFVTAPPSCLLVGCDATN